MAEWQDVHSSSPVRTPKLQVTNEPSTGQRWIPPKKDTPHPRAKEKPQQDSRRGEITFRIKAHNRQRCSEGSYKTLWAPGPRRKEQWPHKRLSQTCLWVYRNLPQRRGSTVTCLGVRGTEYYSAGISLFEGGCHCRHYPYHSLASANIALHINRKLD